jgi:cytochrome c biogenesis protein
MAPLSIECTDIQQTLLKPDGTLDASNTIDWFTRVRVTDAERGQTLVADIHMNKPFDYRGYRFFQSSYQPTANARSVTVEVRRPGAAPETVSLVKLQPVQLSDGSTLTLADFTGNLAQQGAATDWNDPAAKIAVSRPGGAGAIGVDAVPEGSPATPGPDGTTYVLKSFEKVGGSHTLAVQFDPYGAWTFYVGSVILIAALASVFFASHQRLWFVIETDKDGNKKVYAGGHTNRNRPAFEKRFNLAVGALGAPAPTEEGGAV